MIFFVAEKSPMRLKDPICGMAVTERSFYSVEQDGQPVYFCTAQCKSRFAHRARVLSGTPTQPIAPAPTRLHIRRRWWGYVVAGAAVASLAWWYLAAV